MMNSSYYLPILKSKLGEFNGLHQLPSNLKDSIMPLFEITPIEWDRAVRKKPKTIEEHLDGFCEKLSKKWGRSACFIDTYRINHTPINRTTCIEYVFKKLKSNYGLSPVPIIHVANPDGFIESIVRILSEKEIKEIGIRVTAEDVLSPDLQSSVESILDTLSLKPVNCHLQFDLKDANFFDVDAVVDSVLSYLEGFPHFLEWATFSVCSSAFPPMSRIKGPSANIDRNDWKFYKALIAKLSKEKYSRSVNFGDYGIVSPEYFEFDPTKMSSSANIRYTHDNIWYVEKGKALKKKDDFKQYKSLARNVFKSAYFLGERFSAGDLHISRCVKGEEKGTGNSTTWIGVGSNHHFTKVILDLFSNPPSS